MKDMERRGHRHHRGKHREHEGRAKTFRRTRALTFLKLLTVKQETLRAQLSNSEYQAIRPMIEGEQKAIEMVINEYIAFFQVDMSELQEEEQLGEN